MVKDFDYHRTKHALQIQCEGCIIGRQKCQAFNHDHGNRGYPPGAAWCTDLFGPVRTKSTRGNKYGQVIVDLETKFIVTAAIARKYSHPTVIRDFVTLLQRQFDVNVTTIRADANGEFTATWFNDWLKSIGINLVTSIAGAHQRNTWAENAIGRIMDGIRVFLFVSQLPSKLWDYAMEFITHVLNLRPSGDATVTPTKKLFGITPSISHLRVFGAHCFILSQKQAQDKLKPKSVPGRLIGYHCDSLGTSPNGYLIWVPSEGRAYLRFAMSYSMNFPFLKNAVNLLTLIAEFFLSLLQRLRREIPIK